MTTSESSWPEAVQRVAAVLREARVEARVEEFDEGARTAADAASATGAPIDQIVKSLVFACDGRPIVVLVPGTSARTLQRSPPPRAASE